MYDRGSIVDIVVAIHKANYRSQSWQVTTGVDQFIQLAQLGRDKPRFEQKVFGWIACQSQFWCTHDMRSRRVGLLHICQYFLFITLQVTNSHVYLSKCHTKRYDIHRKNPFELE